MDIAQVRQGLADNANTVEGLRCFGYIPDSAAPPVFFAGEVEVTFDRTFGRGLDDLMIRCRVLVPSADDRAGQALLDRYLAGSGEWSIKEALESERTLDGACDDLHVVRVTGYGRYEFNESNYLGAEFTVRVIGEGG